MTRQLKKKIEKFRLESGLESLTVLKYEFLPQTTYASYLRLFTRFNDFDVWDVR